MLPKVGLLIGCGSVGKKHALAMALKYEYIVIVDKDKNIRPWVLANIGVKIEIFNDLDDVPLIELCGKFNITAVIATWGPTHLQIFNILVENGVRRIVCEKPFANSISSAREMISKAQEKNVRVVVGVTRRYTKLADFLNQTLIEYCGGSAEVIVVSGGAHCVATMGAHWLDLAFQLFGSNAINVIGNLRDQNINPRDKTLGYWEGSASWEFPNNKFFTINFTNSSRVASSVEIIGKLGSITIEPTGDIVVKSIELNPVERNQPITRTKLATPVKVIDNMDPFTHFEPFQELLNIVDGSGELPYPLGEVECVLNALLGAFESSLLERKISLPIQQGDVGYTRLWNIS